MSWEEREKTRDRLKLSNRFVLVYLGTLTVWQWPEAMFALAAQIYRNIPETYLYLLIPERDHPRAEELLKNNAIPPDAYRLSEIPHDQVGTVLGIADAGLLLRERHPVNEVASPTKFGEYLAAGVPVIATDGIGDTSEIVVSEQVGVIINIEENRLLEDQMKVLLRFIGELRRDRQNYASRCAEVAARVLGWNERATVFNNIYSELNTDKL